MSDGVAIQCVTIAAMRPGEVQLSAAPLVDTRVALLLRAPDGALRIALVDTATGVEFGGFDLRERTLAAVERAVAAVKLVREKLSKEHPAASVQGPMMPDVSWPVASLAARYDAALRLYATRHDEVSRRGGTMAYQTLFGYLRDRHVPLGEVRYEGLRPSHNAIVEQYVVTLSAPLAGVDRRRFSAALKRWGDDPTAWEVRDAGNGVWIIGRRMNARQFKAEVKKYLGETVADSESPFTFAAPVAAQAPFTDAALRLAFGKVLSRTGGAVPVDALRELLAVIPGWGWGERVLARPLDESGARRFFAALGVGPYDYREKRLGGKMYANIGRNSATDADVQAIQRVAAHAPSLEDHALAATLSIGSWFYGSIEVVDDPDRAWGQGRKSVAMRGPWQITPAWIVTSPSGEWFPIYRGHEVAPQRTTRKGPPIGSVLEEPGFWEWAYRRGLGEVVEGVLAGLHPDDLRDAMLRAKGHDLTNTGECQICEGVQKLKLDHRRGVLVLVDHGYTYPDSEGWRGGILGSREGSCGGVDFVPYEKGYDALDAVLPRIREALLRAEEHLATMRQSIADRTYTIEANGRVLDPASHRWSDQAESELETQVLKIDRLRGQADFVEARIKAWKLRPLYDERVEHRR